MRYLGQCKDQTKHTDRILVQVHYQVSTWSHSWEFNTFHDARLPPPIRARGFSGMLGEFNTYNAELVAFSDMQDHNATLSWPIEAVEYAREYARRLREHGRWAHAWGNPHNWPEHDDREKRLKVRLVREQIAHLTRELEI